MNTVTKLLKTLCVICFVSTLTCTIVNAQWSKTGSYIYPTILTDNVGIGTNSPNSLLHLKKTTDNAFLTIETTSNSKYAGINLIGWHNTSYAISQIYMDYYGATGFHGLNYVSGRNGFSNHWFRGYNGNTQMCILNNGNVGIGCTTPTVKLAVNGKIQATELEIKAAPCADFVFNKDYNLRSLREVERFILLNKHLPDVPSESYIKDNGMNIGQMNAILLQKIEELTLYTIELNKRIEQLQSKINGVKNENNN